MRMRYWKTVGLILMIFFCVTGCKVSTLPEKTIREVEYEVLEQGDIPEEFMEIIEKKKDEVFLSTYGDGTYLYIGQGYGRKEKDGYEIEVDSFVETENFLYFHTNLIGSYEAKDKETFPWIVVRTKWKDKSVIYRKGENVNGNLEDEYSDE